MDRVHLQRATRASPPGRHRGQKTLALSGNHCLQVLGYRPTEEQWSGTAHNLLQRVVEEPWLDHRDEPHSSEAHVHTRDQQEENLHALGKAEEGQPGWPSVDTCRQISPERRVPMDPQSHI